MKDTYTHAQLCEQAGQWLKQQNCNPVIVDAKRKYAGELPDAFGFVNARDTLLVEVKVSESDFAADHKKKSRRAIASMGRLRWLLCPPYLIESYQVYPGWGLLYATETGCYEVIEPDPFQQVNRAEETALLLHHARQLDRKPDKAPVDVSLMKLTQIVQSILIQHGPLPAREIRSAMNCKTSPSKLAKRLQEAGFPCADEGGIRIFSAKD